MNKPIHVMFFCLGNICRSPIAEGVFTHLVKERGLDSYFVIDSAGTSGYHVNEAPDPGSQRVVQKRLGVEIGHQRGQLLTLQHLNTFDVLVALDSKNRKDALRLRPDVHIHLMRDFDTEDRGGDVPDPWGFDDSQFELVFDIVHRSCTRLLDHLIDTNALETT